MLMVYKVYLNISQQNLSDIFPLVQYVDTILSIPAHLSARSHCLPVVDCVKIASPLTLDMINMVETKMNLSKKIPRKKKILPIYTNQQQTPQQMEKG
ncbi:hypothetical protein DERP_008455 [Dermatophagoides pteronyssinus]|uniref:Uncharacterized protein n=1 Tax=Dermatophagoides pteronyssinus TaxID=6956 RepID=A0ABQ8IVA4_DERPT|nr:hypothetical protein DERP_008455 [Dermatophagoides pteronyssinus]